MKRIFTACLLLFCSGILSQASAQIHVDASAAAGGDGSDWPTAFNDLQAALDAAMPGDMIYVAQGIYKPGGDPASTFLIDQDIVLQGGFAPGGSGFNPALYPTILSGDVNGDDVEDDFTMNRADNVMTVVTVAFNVTNAAVINGFIIEGGQADGAGSNLTADKSGGGVYSTGTPRVVNCVFRQNHAAAFGGGAYFQNGQQALEIDSCTFSKNEALSGGGLNIQSTNCTVSNSSFLSNASKQYGGGFWYVTLGDDQVATVTNCLFELNQSSFSGGLRLQSQGNGNSFLVSGCDFKENAALPLNPGWGQSGGGCSVTFWPNKENNNALLEGCYFFRNSSSDYGAAISLSSRSSNSGVEINDCTFLQNEAVTWGAVDAFIDNAGSELAVTVTNSTFQENITGYGGGITGATLFGGKLEYNISGCLFDRNEASEHGAIWLEDWEDSPLIANIDGCIFEGNKGTVNGGALGLLALGNTFETIVSNCVFRYNESPAGGVIDSYKPLSGTPFPDGAKIVVENSILANNIGDAVFTMDATGSLDIRNCTVADNECNGIEIANQSALTLQNTILYNPGHTEYTAATGDVSLTSLGGNLLSDGSLGGINPEDHENETGPLFASEGDTCSYYQPLEGSKAVDEGIDWSEAPDQDMCGNMRVQGNRIDIGAIESPFTSSVREAAPLTLAFFPNPAADFLNIQWPETPVGSLDISIFNAQGSLIFFQVIPEGQPIACGDFPPGLYTLVAVGQGQVYTGAFAKQ